MMPCKFIPFFVYLLLTIPNLLAQKDAPSWVKKIDFKIFEEKQILSHQVETNPNFWNLPSKLTQKLGTSYFSSFSIDTLSKGIERLTLVKEGQQLFEGRIYMLYFEKDKLLKVKESYTNASRMGSCGTLKITNQLYFKDETSIYLSTLEEPFFCYNESPDSSLFVDLGGYFGLFRKGLAFNHFLQKIEAYKQEVDYQANYSLNSALLKANLEEYELKWIKHFLKDAVKITEKNKANFMFWGISIREIIGDKYLISQVTHNDPPMGIQPYSLYYYERKKEANVFEK